jgi:hypothetical protein
MKKIRNIIIWSITSFLIQSAVFFGLDMYYQSTLLNTKVTEVRVPSQNTPKKNITINIPGDAVDVKVSYDGKYISYNENNKWEVVNCFDGTKHEVSPDTNSKIVFTKWFPDSDTMAICENATGKTSVVNIFRYNADNDNKFIPTDSNNHEIKPKIAVSNYKIADIAISSTMGIWYIKVQKSTTKSDILNIDVNGNVLTSLYSKNIGNIDMVKNLPNLIYEDVATGTVKITKKTFNESKKYCLLGTDDDENLYLGLLQNEKISKIIYGAVNKSMTQWTSLTLDTPIEKKEIIITDNGKILTNNSFEGTLTENSTGKKTAYNGTLLKVTNTEVLSLSNGKLERINLS